MPKEFDTRWFDLKNYEPFKTMSVETQIWQLEAREHYHKMARAWSMRRNNDEVDKSLLSIGTNLKIGVIPDDPNYPTDRHDTRAGAILEGHPFSTASVKSLESYDLWKMIQDKSICHVWDACKHMDDYFMTDSEDQSLLNIAQTPHDLNNADFDYWIEYGLIPYLDLVLIAKIEGKKALKINWHD